MAKRIVLAFHGIGLPGPAVPEAERPYWIDEAEFAACIAGLRAEARAAGVAVEVTFDDGNASDLAIAAPRLAEAGLGGAMFVCSSRIGREGYLSGADLRELRAMGFEIGSHGRDHLPWAGLAPETLEAETAGAKAEIEDALGAEVSAAALPFGAYDRRALAAARRAGFSRLYSSDRDIARPGAWPEPRWSYRQDMPVDLALFAAVAQSPARRALGVAKRLAKSLR